MQQLVTKNERLEATNHYLGTLGFYPNNLQSFETFKHYHHSTMRILYYCIDLSSLHLQGYNTMSSIQATNNVSNVW